jgi:hypothetical protein
MRHAACEIENVGGHERGNIGVSIAASGML